jgi:hypothetical protein
MEDVWSLENSMRRYTLRFLDPKIEQSYVLYVNRKYMRYNRLLAIFLVCLSCLSVIYNWLVETWARFIIYLPCNIAMALFCAILFLSTFSTGSLLYYQHLTTTVLLFLTGLSWMFGQPLVLLLLGDPLVLDSAHLIFMFIVFNVAMTPLKV